MKKNNNSEGSEDETVFLYIFGSVTNNKSRGADEQKHLCQWVSILVIITQTTAGFLSKQRLIAINCLHLAAQV